MTYLSMVTATNMSFLDGQMEGRHSPILSRRRRISP
jgi:hypothetical protein